MGNGETRNRNLLGVQNRNGNATLAYETNERERKTKTVEDEVLIKGFKF